MQISMSMKEFGASRGENMVFPDCIQCFLAHCKLEKKLSVKTSLAYASDLKQFVHYVSLEQKAVATLEKQDMVAYATVLSRKYKASSAKRKIATLKALYGYLEREEIVAESPFRRIKLAMGRGRSLPRSLPYSAILAMVRACAAEHAGRPGRHSQRNLLLLLLLATTGMRVSEVCGIRMENVDLVGRCIRIVGKGSRERSVPVFDEATHEVLAEYLRTERGGAHQGFLFPGQGPGALSDQTVRALVKRLARTAGIPAPVTPHVFRHSIATYLLELGVDIRNIQALLGHSSISVTEIYTKVTPEAHYRVLNEKFPGVGLGGQR